MRLATILVILLFLYSCEENLPPLCSIASPTENTEFKIGESFNIRVEASDPDGSIIEVRLFLNDSGMVTLKDFPYNYELSSANLAVGPHRIKASAYDDKGSVTSDIIEISVIQPPLSVTTNEITNISFTSATFLATISENGGSAIISRGFCLGTSPIPTINDDTIICGSGTGNFQGSLNDLVPGTNYHIRAFGINNDGITYGNELNFSTLTSTLKVTTKIVSDVTNNSASSGGNITSDGGSEITSRGVCWSKSNNPTISNNITSDGSGTGDFTSILTNLDKGTLYNVRAYATNTNGTSYGEEISFTTINMELPTVTTLEPQSITANSAFVVGGISNAGGGTIISKGFCWSIDPDPSLDDSFAEQKDFPIDNFFIELTDLNPETTYYYRAYATNEAGTSYGKSKSFTTLYATEVVFNVDMTIPIYYNQLSPETGFVDLVGSFTGWDSNPVRLSDEDGDKIYSATITFEAPFPLIEFKFRINGDWATSEFAAGGANRYYQVLPGYNRLDCTYDFRPKLEVGMEYLGGIIIYLDESGNHGIICAKEDLSGTAIQSCTNNDISGSSGTSLGDGRQNTLAINTNCNNASNAANLCLEYSVENNGQIFDDWYLPSSEELGLIYFVNITIGIGGLQNSTNDSYYWTSSLSSVSSGFAIDLFDGSKAILQSSNSKYVRAIRYF